jgi:hypothetical protein
VLRELRREERCGLRMLIAQERNACCQEFEMPITPSRTVADPYGPLAWNASLAVLALEKLRRGTKDLSMQEQNALSTLARELTLLSEASTISGDELLEGKRPLSEHLQKSFHTLVAIEERASLGSSPIMFKEGGQDIGKIMSQLSSASPTPVDPTVVSRAQEVCLNLLEYLDGERPACTIRRPTM